MADKPKVLINSFTDHSYNALFPADKCEVINSEEWAPCDLLVLVGHSSDVDPGRYEAVPISECGVIDEHQDCISFDLLAIAYKYKVPVLGICKGAQQMCVFKGGYLIQHVPRVGNHRVSPCSPGMCFEDVPADHHQVMVPAKSAFCETIMVNGETLYPDVIKWDSPVKKPLWVGIQFHPEWAPKDHVMRSWFSGMVKEMLKK